MGELTTQLTSLLVVRIILGNIVELGVPFFSSKLQQCLNYFRAKKSAGEDETIIRYPEGCPEKQSTMPLYSDELVSGALYDYLELSIQFGLVTLFAPGILSHIILSFIAHLITRQFMDSHLGRGV